MIQIALKMKKYEEPMYSQELEEVYEYIKHYWKHDKTFLSAHPFNLEELLSLLDLQYRDGIKENDESKCRKISQIFNKVTRLLGDILSEFWHDDFLESPMRVFGQILYKDKSVIITFNYDTFIERSIEYASMLKDAIPFTFRGGMETPSFAELAYSYWNWNRALAYCVNFNEVVLHQPGIRRYVEGSSFYAHPQNKMYDEVDECYILKLHGSLNWFYYLPISRIPSLSDEPKPTFPEEKKDHTIVSSEDEWTFRSNPYVGEWFVAPIIVPPVVSKLEYVNQGIYQKALQPVWDKAKQVLSNCKRLVVIGYSFPTSDFLTMQLFLEAFSENNLAELIVVSPDPSVVQKVKRLCHFDKDVVAYKDLGELVANLEIT